MLIHSRRDALRQHGGHLCADAEQFDMRDFLQARQQPLQAVVGQGQRIAAGEQNVADVRIRGDIGQRSFPFGRVDEALMLAAENARAGAVTAVGGAEIRHQEKNAVRIAVHDAGHGRIRVLTQRVLFLAFRVQAFVDDRNNRTAQRGRRILRIEQARVIGGDGHGEVSRRVHHGLAFVVGQVDEGVEGVHVTNGVLKLPVPVVPLDAADTRVMFFSESAGAV
jgi:hypothetical protein